MQQPPDAGGSGLGVPRGAGRRRVRRIFDLFRALDEKGLPVLDSEIDYEALGEAIDSGRDVLGEFLNT